MNPFDELMGVPINSLLRLALEKRAKAVEDRCQDLRFRTTNTKFAITLQSYIRRRNEFIRRMRVHEMREQAEAGPSEVWIFT